MLYLLQCESLRNINVSSHYIENDVKKLKFNKSKGNKTLRSFVRKSGSLEGIET